MAIMPLRFEFYCNGGEKTLRFTHDIPQQLVRQSQLSGGGGAYDDRFMGAVAPILKARAQACQDASSAWLQERFMLLLSDSGCRDLGGRVGCAPWQLRTTPVRSWVARTREGVGSSGNFMLLLDPGRHGSGCLRRSWAPVATSCCCWILGVMVLGVCDGPGLQCLLLLAGSWVSLVLGVMVLGVMVLGVMVLGVMVLGVMVLGVMVLGVMVLGVMVLGVMVLGVMVLGVMVLGVCDGPRCLRWSWAPVLAAAACQILGVMVLGVCNRPV
ncbi:hypothetical protein ACCO45_007873 [Purpureocillium lilacinum]|uniref:Uncharacterized protein n=1 Tax=Purpureocillium lilacinum TaxID=33203 RepID=A0ACC4DLN7_PURLI